MNPRPSGFKLMTQIYIYFSTDEKKPESFDPSFLMVVGEELDSNISEPPTLCISTRKSAILFCRRKKTVSFDTVFLMVIGEEPRF